ncbi:MAG: metalloregulator ArsR/SmtB family transcription factor [Rhodoferax sp.]
MNTSDRVLYLIKTHGPRTAQQLGQALGMTSMAARRHLETWESKGLLHSQDQAEKVGRPARYWSLTEAGHARFPDRHGELTAQLIDQVRSLFGEQGMDRLLAAREHTMCERYADAMEGATTLAQRLQALTQARDEEGYMAEVQAQADGSFLLTEHHCPICAAASRCQGFCRSELAVFQQAIGTAGSVCREEHLLSGGQRCVYRITPV